MLHGEGCRLHGYNTGFSYYPGLPSAGLLPGAEGGSLPATPLHAQLTHCSLTLLSLGSWFMLHGMALCLLRDRHTKGCLAAMGSLTGKLSLGKWLSCHEFFFGFFFFPLGI